MTDSVLSSLIGVGGAVLVAITSTITQMVSTRSVLRAERVRAREQHVLEEHSRRRERLEERIHRGLARLIAISEPNAGHGQISRQKAAIAIQRLQLLLEIELDRPAQRALNDAINKLGVAIEAHTGAAGSAQLLHARDAVIDLSRAALREVLDRGVHINKLRWADRSVPLPRADRTPAF